MSTYAKSGVRKTTSSSCDIIRVNLGLGMTTQIVLDQEPKVTLYADKTHFKINTTPVSPRSVSIIPFVDPAELNVFRDVHGKLPSPKNLAMALDKSFKTNLFIFFDNDNQLMFELHFVEKKKADYLLKVRQTFKKDCVL
jgi:hypothetical protein